MALPSVTYIFSNSTTADATQVNTNFTDLINAMTDGTKSFSIDALTCAGAVTFNGNVTMGNSSVDDISFMGSVNSSIAFKTTFDFDIGSSTVGVRDVYFGSDDDAARTVKIRAGTIASSYTFTLPTSGGTSGYVLTTNGSGVTSWRAGAGKKVYRSVITTDGPTSVDDILACSGNSFTITLPDATAAANVNKVFTILHLGTSLTQVYTLATTSAQTIGGIASGSYKLITNGERLKIISDGSNWQILSHDAKTDWLNIGAVTLGGTTTAPTKASGINVDKMFWRRDGRDVHIRYEYSQSNTTSANAGSGDYLIPLPSNMSADTSMVDVYATVEGSGTFQGRNSLGSVLGGTTGESYSGGVSLYDATNVRFFLVGIEPTPLSRIGPWGSSGALANLTVAGVFMSASYKIPIADWQP